MVESDLRMQIALKSAFKWFCRIFTVGFVASLVGVADFIIHPILKDMARQDLGWLSKIVFDFIGPGNMAQALRDYDVTAFAVFVAFLWFMYALTISCVVFVVKSISMSAK